ncbi:MAG TPA: RCC1 domain-containing protein, partial [Lysobacter sp.]|nr:RCC1 domain-containing protein [Lysobacter sp.]
MSNRLGRALRGLSLVCLWLIAAVSAAPALAQTQVVQEGFAPQIHNGVTALAAGWHHSCALHSDGSVFCWGNNDAGQSTPPPATRFIAISAGWFDTCGVRDDHTLTCWGQKPELREVPNGDFDSVAVNDQSQACALNSQGYVRCWGPGYNVWGAQPQSNYVALSAAGDQTCGLSAKYYVIECWRAETVAQPLTVPGGPYRALSVGMDQVCGLQESGEVRCWDTGNNSEREGRAGPFIALTAGGSGVCALNQYGHAECWGSGQLLAPVPADSFTTLIAGHDHACAIRPDGAVSCWGGNYFGEAIPP